MATLNGVIGEGEVWVNTGAGFDTVDSDDANVAPAAVDPETNLANGLGYLDYNPPVESTLVISVDGVENVIAGLGNDTCSLTKPKQLRTTCSQPARVAMR